jgi:hypothetical protein
VEVLGTGRCFLELWKDGTHKVAGCPDLGKAKSDENPKVKEVPAVNTASLEPLPARKLLVVDWEIDTREEGDQGETISCLLDTGSEITMARTDMKDFAENVCMIDVGFSEVGLKGGLLRKLERFELKLAKSGLTLGCILWKRFPRVST